MYCKNGISVWSFASRQTAFDSVVGHPRYGAIQFWILLLLYSYISICQPPFCFLFELLRRHNKPLSTTFYFAVWNVGNKENRGVDKLRKRVYNTPEDENWICTVTEGDHPPNQRLFVSGGNGSNRNAIFAVHGGGTVIPLKETGELE